MQRKSDARIVNSGKRMRHEVITAINSTGPDMAVQCSEKNLDDVNTYQSFHQVRAFLCCLPVDACFLARCRRVP